VIGRRKEKGIVKKNLGLMKINIPIKNKRKNHFPEQKKRKGGLEARKDLGMKERTLSTFLIRAGTKGGKIQSSRRRGGGKKGDPHHTGKGRNSLYWLKERH